MLQNLLEFYQLRTAKFHEKTKQKTLKNTKLENVLIVCSMLALRMSCLALAENLVLAISG